MIGTIQARAAKTALCLALICPQVSWAEEFTGKQFRAWDEAAQKAFLQNTMIMAALVSSRTNPEHGDCISGWFFDSDGVKPERFDDAVKRIAEYDTYRPSAVLVAMIEQECGPFGAS